MTNNPYVNKVEYAGQTVMDLTGDTVQPSSVLNGVTFHDRSGAPQTGSMITHNVYDGLDSASTDDALSANQGKVLNDLLKDETFNATPSTGVTFPINKGYKNGIRTKLELSFSLSSGVTSRSDLVIGSIPSQYAPPVNASSFTINGFDTLAVFINSSGVIHLRCMNGSLTTIEGQCVINW